MIESTPIELNPNTRQLLERLRASIEETLQSCGPTSHARKGSTIALGLLNSLLSPHKTEKDILPERNPVDALRLIYHALQTSPYDDKAAAALRAAAKGKESVLSVPEQEALRKSLADIAHDQGIDLSTETMIPSRRNALATSLDRRRSRAKIILSHMVKSSLEDIRNAVYELKRDEIHRITEEAEQTDSTIHHSHDESERAIEEKVNAVEAKYAFTLVTTKALLNSINQPKLVGFIDAESAARMIARLCEALDSTELADPDTLFAPDQRQGLDYPEAISTYLLSQAIERSGMDGDKRKMLFEELDKAAVEAEIKPKRSRPRTSGRG